MHHFAYRDGVLHAEDVDLNIIADEIGTPFYCYSSATLERHYRVMAEAFNGTDHFICYAMKANSNQSVLRTLAKLGAGADVVSGGDLERDGGAQLGRGRFGVGLLLAVRALALDAVLRADQHDDPVAALDGQLFARLAQRVVWIAE